MHPGKNNFTVSKDGGEVDAITASTITSRAFLRAIQNAYDKIISGQDVTSGATQQAAKKEAACDGKNGCCHAENSPGCNGDCHCEKTAACDGKNGCCKAENSSGCDGDCRCEKPTACDIETPEVIE